MSARLDVRTLLERGRVSPENVASWWGRIQPLERTLFAEAEGRSESDLFKALVASEAVIELPFGVIRIGKVRPPWYVELHGFFWSSDVYRYLEELRELRSLILHRYDVLRLLVEVPVVARGIRRLLGKLGFEVDGYSVLHFHKGRFPSIIYTWRNGDG